MTIDFNIGCDPIITQLMNQGIFCDSTGSRDLGELQKAMNALELLKRNNIVRKESKIIERRLKKRIIEYVKEHAIKNVQTVDNTPETKPYNSGHDFTVCEHCGAKQCTEQPQSSLHAFDIVYDCKQSVTFIVGNHSSYIDNKTCENGE